jgi:hypothetical protein
MTVIRTALTLIDAWLATRFAVQAGEYHGVAWRGLLALRPI